MAMNDSYFVRLDARRFRATEHTGGAWVQSEQHIAPMVGLVVHEIEQHVVRRDGGSGGDDGKRLGRLSFDILGVIDVGEVSVDVETLRPGRTIELIEATVSADGRPVVRARAWRAATSETRSVVGGQPAPIPAPEETPVWDMASVWPGGFIASIDVRRSADALPGRAQAWMSTPLPLVDDEPVSPTASFLGLVDTANGMCVRQPPDQWLFPNLDLGIYLYREPVPGPTGLDTTIVFGADGLGMTEAVLHDLAGPVGRLTQTLTLRDRAPHT